MTQEQSYMSLSQLQALIKRSLQNEFKGYYWVVAEVSEVSVNAYSHHCYLTLVEKNETTQLAKARVNANIWANTFMLLEPYFKAETGRTLEVGMKLLLKVSVNYHEIYGISFNVSDIDPTYTLGDIERQRKMIIEALKADGLLELNKSRELPRIVQKLAVVSSSTAAGFRDFEKELRANEYGFKYEITLFNSIMQGQGAEQSIVKSLHNIAANAEKYDVAIVIRGGGATTDLACFDQYELCCEIATMPIVVITGIGHDKDVSIADMTAHTALKTPTAVARYIVDYTREFDKLLDENLEFLENYALDYFNTEKERIEKNAQFLKIQTSEYVLKADKVSALALQKLNHLSKRLIEKTLYENELKQEGLKIIATRIISDVERKIDDKKSTLKTESLNYVLQQQQLNERLSLIVEGYNPQRILKNGYSIARFNNKVLSSGKNLSVGDELTITLSDVEVSTKVVDIEARMS
ncbi:MAG: exodeoxyribonuclease VII large subunit [Rikenellaceae bacterium]